MLEKTTKPLRFAVATLALCAGACVGSARAGKVPLSAPTTTEVPAPVGEKGPALLPIGGRLKLDPFAPRLAQATPEPTKPEGPESTGPQTPEAETPSAQKPDAQKPDAQKPDGQKPEDEVNPNLDQSPLEKPEEPADSAAGTTPGAGPGAEGEAAGSTEASLENAPPVVAPKTPKPRIIPPFYFQWWNKRGTDHVLAIPFYMEKSSRKSFHVFFPLVWNFADREARSHTTVLFPIAMFHGSPGTTSGYFATAYWYKSKTGWAGGLAPIAFFGNLNGKRHGVLFPLFFSGGDEKSSTYVAGPFYYKKHTALDDTGEGWDTGLLPILFAGRHQDRSYFSLAGLFTRVANNNGSTYVVGPVYGSKRKDGYAYGLAPLFNFSRSGTSTTQWFLPPLYVHSSDEADKTQFTMFGPVFRARTAAGQTQGVFPLAWDVDRGPTHASTLLPLYFHYKNDETKKEGWQVGPYVRVRDELHHKLTQVFFPLFIKHDAPDYGATVLLPLFWRVRDKDQTNTVVLPFYGGVRKPGYQGDVVFPLFWRFAGKDTNDTVVANVFYHRRGENTDGGVLPLFGWGTRGKASSYFWGLPLLYHDQSEKSSHTWFATFYYGRHERDWTSFLIPLYGGYRRGDRARVFGIPFYFGRDDEKNDALLIAGPLYRGRSAHTWYTGFFPILWTSKHDDGGGQVTFFPLFHWANKSDGGHRLVTLLGGFATSANQDNKYVIGPTYFRTQQGTLRSLFLPLPVFYWGKEKETGDITSFWFPFYLYNKNRETSLTAITPLFWRYHTVESMTHVALLYFDHHDYYRSKSFGVLPLFYHKRDFVKHESTHQVLAYYQRVSPTENDRILFPLYWHWQRGTDTTDIVAPIVWTWKRGNDRTTIVAPVMAHWTREDGNRTIVLNLYWRKGKGVDEGTWSFHFFPLFNFGVPVKGGYEWGLFGGAITVRKTPQAKTLRLFWNFDIKLGKQPTQPAAPPTQPAGKPRASAEPVDLFF